MWVGLDVVGRGRVELSDDLGLAGWVAGWLGWVGGWCWRGSGGGVIYDVLRV